MSAVVSAATVNDIVAALKDAGVPEVYVTQAESYLNSRTVTSEQADAVIEHILNAKTIANGVTELSKLTVNQKTGILEEISQAVAQLDLTASFSNGVITIKDADSNTVFSVSSSDVIKQTGYDYSPILVGLAILLIAGIAGVFVRRSLRQEY
ncbi:MAG: hypothetical protein Q7J78_06730 [Clostridiales bacterium]|nr:hypothetical protein [Clostridiales bacterium]